MKWLLVFLLPCLMAFDTPLEDTRQEARALALMEEIRCVACENEPISQSGADIASDMRAQVREMIGDGASDAEVRRWFVDRYGEFVLFRPSARGTSGLVLWGLPFALLLIGGLVSWLSRRQPEEGTKVQPVPADAFDHDKENRD